MVVPFLAMGIPRAFSLRVIIAAYEPVCWHGSA
jgi:hypothetical protein